MSRALVLFLLFGFPITSLGAEYYCTYFGGVSENMKSADLSIFQLQKEGCIEGDALHLIVYDRSKSAKGREILYMASEIAQLCDLSMPVTVLGQVAAGSGEAGAYHAVCTYAGTRRRPRPADD